MGWNLPPGCTDKDIDDAINGDEPPLTPEEMREEDEATFIRLKEYIEFHRRNLLPVDSLREAIERYRECGE